MTEYIQNYSDYLVNKLPDATDIRYCAMSHAMFVTVEPGDVARALFFLRDDARSYFKTLVSICGIDYPEREKRFEVVYNLLSYKSNVRLYLKTQVAEDESIPSATEIYGSAGWYERETWDMYGVLFAGNPDLRRILTDYGFEGHPLRKDFPLTGYVQVAYSDEHKKVMYEPVKLEQEFRNFDFESPWEGTQYAIPGDEKAGSK